MSKTAAIPMDKEIQSFQFIFTGQQYNFVKIVRKKNDNFDLALRKRRFCNAKQPLLPCKTYAFGMQNNRFCNMLVNRKLCDYYLCEKYLQFYSLLFLHRKGCFYEISSSCFSFWELP